MFSKINFRSLSTQIVLISVALVLLTVMAIGAPAIWLIREQMDHQAWNQMEQGNQASQALYADKQKEVAGLALLMAQRPTLRALIIRGDKAALSAYLDTLYRAADLDLIIICQSDRQALARTGAAIAGDVCPGQVADGFHVITGGSSSPQAWLFAARPIGNEDDDLGEVIVGVALDNAFAAEMSAKTRLEHTLLVEGQPVATSFPGGIATKEGVERQLLPPTASDGAARGRFDLGTHPYYFIRLPLDDPRLKDELALSVADIIATRYRLMGILVASILGIASVGSVLGAVMAQRITRPLKHLTDAATEMSAGNWNTSLAVKTEVSEITLVSQALERARVERQRTLTHLQDEKAWTDHLLASITEGIVTLDQKQCITFFSRGAEDITGWRHDQVLGLSCDDVFKPVYRDEPFSQLIPAPGRRHNIVVELKGGQQFTLSITGAQLTPPERGEIEAALVFRDVSEEDAMNRLLGHFLANIAHEFRTPLSALAASIELLMDRTSTLSQAELRDLLTSLHLGILSLQTLVDNLLEGASIEAGRFRVYPRPSSLGEITAEALRMMQPLLDKRRQRLVVKFPESLPLVRADPRRTVQVLINLLSNASKYGPDQADIVVSATTMSAWVCVTVADRGPGIPLEYREHLFRRFMLPAPGDDDANAARYGVGLGLSVVKAIVEAQDGQVGVEDRPDGGSIFWFTLAVVEK